MKNKNLIYSMVAAGLLTPVTSLTAQNLKVIEKEFIYQEAPFPNCHASTIEEIPGGVIAAWFGGTREKDPDVEVYISRKLDGSWSKPVSVANGIQHADKRYPCWNPVLFKYPDNGPLLLFYKVGPNPREWWGELKISHDNGKTWGTSCRLPEEILGPVKNKPVLLEDGRLFCGSSTEQDGWRVHFEVTRDTGKSWELIGPINDASEYDVIQPSILTYPDGRMQILCRSKQNNVISSWSHNGGSAWTQLEPTELPNPNSGIDAVTLQDGWQMIVYNHSNNQTNQWGPRTPLNMAVSKDGKNWKQVLTLEDSEGEYSYPAIIQDKDGFIHITYTYKREKIRYVKVESM